MTNPYKAKTRRSSAPESNEVPAGTISELISWVGEDKERAQRVLDQENEQSKPRKSLVTQLEEILADDPEPVVEEKEETVEVVDGTDD